MKNYLHILIKFQMQMMKPIQFLSSNNIPLLMKFQLKILKFI